MCRGKDECSELGLDPQAWDKECPLRPPDWFEDEISKFVESLEHLLRGDRIDCLGLISAIKGEEMTDWYIEHGQMAGRHRKRLLGLREPGLVSDDFRDPLRSPKKYQKAVFDRDSYRCRYCGGRLASQDVLKWFIKVLDSDDFKKGPTNLTTHGIIHAMWPVADHVIPWNMGGRTDLQNLVTSCGACNYGKDGYTCEQMGISNPLDRAPISNGWDGLASRESALKELYYAVVHATSE